MRPRYLRTIGVQRGFQYAERGYFRIRVGACLEVLRRKLQVPVDGRAIAMRKIFDDLGKAETDSPELHYSKNAVPKPFGKMDHRRTRRARVQVPLLVYGYAPNGDPFSEQAHTIEINAHGALIALKTAMRPGERLLLTNETNQKTVECKVQSLATGQGQVIVVAVAFSTPAPEFWRKLSQ
jgi:hypothetical protein